MAKHYVSLRFQLKCFIVFCFQSCWQFSSKCKWIFAQWSKLLWVSWFVSRPPSPEGGCGDSARFFHPLQTTPAAVNAENSSNALRTVAPPSSWDSFRLSFAFSLAFFFLQTLGLDLILNFWSSRPFKKGLNKQSPRVKGQWLLPLFRATVEPGCL